MKATFHRLANELKGYFQTSRRDVTIVLPVQTDEVRFVDVQRRIRIYLRALWEVDFVMKQVDPAAMAEEGSAPYIEYSRIRLPHALGTETHADGDRTGAETYRAAAAHAAAHLIYSTTPFSARSLDKLQIALISVIEDARVEALSIRQFPGLQSLWARQHRATSLRDQTAGDYLDRLARALLDRTCQDDDDWIDLGRRLFDAIDDLEDAYNSRVVGLRLAEAFREKGIRFNAHGDRLTARYRDDHRFLWTRAGPPLDIINPYARARTALGVKRSEGGKAKKSSRTPLTNESDNTLPVQGTYFYPEWNYRSQTSDQSWVTLREANSASGDLSIIRDILVEHKHLLGRMKRALSAVRDGAAARVRKLEEGDEVDVNAAIRAQLDIRQGLQHDPRVMMRSVRKTRDIAVLLLLDMSRSMNEKIPGYEHTALQLTQQVSVLFAEAIAAIGDTFAIHGFTSESRHNVEYFRLKDFSQPYDEVAKAKIAGISGQQGTRMGAAIRHATYCLNAQKSSKKQLFLISDGAPSDIDVPDQKYLRDDTKKAVEEARRNGIQIYCISLDPGADRYVSRIFGAKRYMVVDHIKCLPEKMLRLYATLTR